MNEELSAQEFFKFLVKCGYHGNALAYPSYITFMIWYCEAPSKLGIFTGISRILCKDYYRLVELFTRVSESCTFWLFEGILKNCEWFSENFSFEKFLKFWKKAESNIIILATRRICAHLLQRHYITLSSAIFENSHSTTYRIFKQSLHFEKYLTDLPKKERIVLCRFRCANHHLPIVSGRYSNIPRNMRFCNLCNLQSLGDEFHYLFECPFFANDRNLFLKRYFIRRPNTFKMDQLFNSTHIKTILNLVKFCRKITKHFE